MIVRPSFTDWLKYKLLTPVSGYNCSGVFTPKGFNVPPARI